MTDDPDETSSAGGSGLDETPDVDSDVSDARADTAGVDSDAPETGVDATDTDSGTDAGSVTTGRRSISPRVRYLWGIRMLVGVGLLTLALSWISSTFDQVPTWAGPAAGVVLLVGGVAWVHRRYAVWTYEVRADSLYLERGVFTHVRTIAPFVRIQHVDTQRGPMERWFGLSTLVVYTAGTRGADVSIPGLLPHEARDLQARVKELAIEAEGGDAV